ncbi:MAG: prepilin-type N-terminal cleavage/methylation domain-containing protein [Chthoniobacterales bacterium]|nr:prepilin-type N-terminal cleavage/methylation domain-containing protein [Chthoniobacterales bacterium]
MKRGSSGFTLLELIAVVAILSMLATLAIPHFEKVRSRAQSIVCTNNLRQIGIGVLAYVGENDNLFPIIEPNPNSPVYLPEDEATPLYVELEPYGVTQQVLTCPSDIKGPNYFAQRTTVIDGKSYGTSYQWRPIIDDENAISPKIYGGRRGAGVRIVKPSRVTLCTDFVGVHSGRMNRLYADGHVSKPY